MSHINAETDFGLALLKQTKDNESVVLSPLSISLALALVHAGAEHNTKKEIREALLKGANVTDEELISHYKQLGENVLSSEAVKVLVANRMYIREGFKVYDAYLDAIKKNYAAKAEVHNFSKGKECADHVNKFVRDVTHGKITDLVQENTFDDAVALIVNAVYLDAVWEHVFNSDSTREDDFYVKEGVITKVQYMSHNEVHRLYGETDEAQILTLKYKDPAFAFTILLPKEKFGLAKLRANLTGEKLQSMLKSVQSTYINLKFPKFKIEKELPLKEVLQAIGITDLFSESLCDLSGIAQDLYASEAKHKAVIEVDERGVKAAAATAIRLTKRCAPMAPPCPVIFEADRPFFYTVTQGDNVLFLGNYAT